MPLDTNTVDHARGSAVLLHPHPDFGGNRFHPFVDGLFHSLPAIGINAIRFDFTSAELEIAQEEAVAAVNAGMDRWPQLPLILVGYSFGAGIAAHVADEQLAGSYLLAPPSTMLSGASIGSDHRPKAVVVPDHDQFSPPATIAREVAQWESVTITTLPNTDHFLGDVQPIVEHALSWIGGLMSR